MTSSSELVPAPVGWPEPPAPDAFYGLAGDIVGAIAPHTEADPVAVGCRSGKLRFWALVFGCVFFLFLQARRKMQAQPEFALQKRKRLPLFFWQAVFILLPVAGLAGFGLYSLRQDRMLAEQEARESGEILAQRLAQAI